MIQEHSADRSKASTILLSDSPSLAIVFLDTFCAAASCGISKPAGKTVLIWHNFRKSATEKCSLGAVGIICCTKKSLWMLLINIRRSKAEKSGAVMNKEVMDIYSSSCLHRACMEILVQPKQPSVLLSLVQDWWEHQPQLDKWMQDCLTKQKPAPEESSQHTTSRTQDARAIPSRKPRAGLVARAQFSNRPEPPARGVFARAH